MGCMGRSRPLASGAELYGQGPDHRDLLAADVIASDRDAADDQLFGGRERGDERLIARVGDAVVGDGAVELVHSNDGGSSGNQEE